MRVAHHRVGELFGIRYSRTSRSERPELLTNSRYGTRVGKPALLTSRAAMTPLQTNCDKTAGLSSFWGCFSEFVLMHLTNRVEDSRSVAVSEAACADKYLRR